MERKTTLGLGCLLLASCGNGLPSNAPEFKVEVAATTRADSFSCFAGKGEDGSGDDDFEAVRNLGDALPTPPELQSKNNLCLRFTVLNPDGTPALGEAGSSCSINPLKALGAGSNQVALALDPVGALKDQKEFLMRVDFFEGTTLTQTGLVSNFTLDEEEGPKRALTFFQEEQLSCLVPQDIFKGETDTAKFQEKTILETPRGFHSATTIGDLGAGEAEGVLIAGGTTGLFGTVIQDNETKPRVHDTIEVFNRATMRFIPQTAVTLKAPRAFHDSFALPSRDGELQVLLVGGTTEPNGLGNDIRLFIGDNLLSPFPILPIVAFDVADPTGTYGAQNEKGAEVVTLNAKTLAPIDSQLIETPGRFGAAVVGIGERVFSFGGVATSEQDQTCQDLVIGGGKTLTNFLCDDGIVLTRGLTNEAANFTSVNTGSMGTSRFGASAVRVDDGANDTVLIIGGNITDAAKVAQLATIDVDGVATYTDIAIQGAATAELRRSFFALSAVPGAANQFVMFGGDRIFSDTGRLIEGAGDNGNNTFGVPNFAAFMTLDLTDPLNPQLNITPLAGPSISTALTRPGSDLLLPIVEFVIEFTQGVFTDVTLADLDKADEDINPTQGSLNFCQNDNQDCAASNLGERIAYPVVTPGPNDSLLFSGGIRGPMFPQDEILKFSLDDNGSPVLEELKNPTNNESLHLYRRALGGRGVFLPGHGAGSLVMFTGGITGIVTPSNSQEDLFFFENPLFLGARRDTSFLSFGAPVFDVATDECEAPSDDGFTESEACGFANSSLKDRKLFFIPIKK